MKAADFLGLRWDDEDRPLVEPPAFSPLIADPSFLFPEETPEGDWRLFAHGAWGIHEFSSNDGISWRNRGVRVRNAMRPFVRKASGGGYFLAYEKYAPLALPLTVLPRRPKWNSRLELRSSADLRRWGPPRTIAEPSLPWMADPEYGRSVSNPCLVEDPAGTRLYYSASLAHVSDCGFEEPRYLALAVAAPGAGPEGPYVPRGEPIVDPADDPRPGVIGAGSMKVLRFEDGWIGLQNKIYSDGSGRSRSAIFLLSSEDGIAWKLAREEPLVAPSGGRDGKDGWRSTHVYACDCRFRAADGRWHLYYNARDGWYKASGRERIGRLVSR